MGLTRWSQPMQRAPQSALAFAFFPHADPPDFAKALASASLQADAPALSAEGGPSVATAAIPEAR